MAEECIEISNADGAVALPDDICCNCSSRAGIRSSGCIKELLINSFHVIPAEAGIQKHIEN